jgi:hypothetical protein
MMYARRKKKRKMSCIVSNYRRVPIRNLYTVG